MRVVAYTRVSGRGQVSNGSGLDVQAATCRAFAADKQHDLVAVLPEEGISGDRADRPVLAQALAMVKHGEVEAILVPRLDRLARDVVLQEMLVREVSIAGGRLLSAMPGEDELLADPKDPTRKLMRQILGAFAEYEKSVIALRLAAGRAHKRANGGKASGAYPFGWTIDGPDDREQGVLSTIKTLLSQGSTLNDVAAYLNNRPGHHPRHAARWSRQTVASVIKRAGLR